MDFDGLLDFLYVALIFFGAFLAKKVLPRVLWQMIAKRKLREEEVRVTNLADEQRKAERRLEEQMMEQRNKL